MSAITTHVLDTALGKPAEGVAVTLELEKNGAWQMLGQGQTGRDGRVANLLLAGPPPKKGIYRLHFELRPYFARSGRAAFYPYAEITFELLEPSQHYHIPLLLSGFGFSTYRGS